MLLSTISLNFRLIGCSLNETLVSNEIQEKIKKKTQFNEKYIQVSDLIILNKLDNLKQVLESKMDDIEFLQEALFFCCVWDKIDLCKLILNKSLDFDINFRLDVSYF